MLFFILCVYTTLYYIRPFEWFPGLINTPIFLIVSAASIVVLIGSWLRGGVNLFRFKTDWMVLGFTVSIIMSHLRHGDFYLVVPSFVKFFPAFVGYFLVMHGIDTEKKLKYFVAILILLSTFLGYEAYLQVHTGYAHGGLEPLLDWSDKDTVRARWYGMFNDPNDLGLALVLVVPFLINNILSKKYFVSSICLPVILYGLYLTNSRGATLALIAAVFTYIVLRNRSIKGVVLGLILASLIVTLGPSRMAQMSASEGSAHGRLDAWYEGFQMFKSYPLFGVGCGQFTEYHGLTAHNSFVLVLSELGLFGSFFFLYFFYMPLRWAKVNLLNIFVDDELNDHMRFFFCAGIGALVGLLSSMFFLSRSYILLPFMIVALLSRMANINSNQDCSDKLIFNYKEAWFVLFGFILFIVIVVKALI